MALLRNLTDVDAESYEPAFRVPAHGIVDVPDEVAALFADGVSYDIADRAEVAAAVVAALTGTPVPPAVPPTDPTIDPAPAPAAPQE